ncbi:MAG TPA: caspase family protein [Herpetosiphonaceae bacterium]
MALKALLVGINQYDDRPLRGCVNDAQAMAELLAAKHGLAAEDTRLLLDVQATRAAIIDGLRWLAEPDGDGAPGQRVFLYAGHGTQQADTNGDEPDGADECLMPFDYKAAGLLTDDTLRELYGGFLGQAKLLLLMDCCHSGTIHKDPFSDVRQRLMPLLPAEFKRIQAAKQRFRDHKTELLAAQIRDIASRELSAAEVEAKARELGELVSKQPFGGAETAANAVVFSACRADQTAADARFGDEFHGAFTFFLSLALRGDGAMTYGQLGDHLTTALADSKFAQVPQLECDTALLSQPFLGAAG